MAKSQGIAPMMLGDTVAAHEEPDWWVGGLSVPELRGQVKRWQLLRIALEEPSGDT